MYKYAHEKSYYFRHDRRDREELVHIVFSELLESPEKIESIKFYKSWIVRAMLWKCRDIYKSAYRRSIMLVIDNEYDDLSFMDTYTGSQINSPESIIDLKTIKKYINSKEYNPSNFKGHTMEILEMSLNGYKPEEISKALLISKQGVNNSMSNMRKKVRKHFENI